MYNIQKRFLSKISIGVGGGWLIEAAIITVKIVSTMFDSKHIASFTGITLVHKINVRPWTRSLYLSS